MDPFSSLQLAKALTGSATFDNALCDEPMRHLGNSDKLMGASTSANLRSAHESVTVREEGAFLNSFSSKSNPTSTDEETDRWSYIMPGCTSYVVMSHPLSQDQKLTIEQTSTTLPVPTFFPPSRNIITFPLDIIEEIFDFLTPVQSTCLGLTCSNFYSIHKARHNRVRLQEIDYLNMENLTENTTTTLLGCTPIIDGFSKKKVMLGELLRDWMGPDYKLCGVFRNTSTVRCWVVEYNWTPKKFMFIKRDGNEEVPEAMEQALWGIRQ